MLPGFGVSVPAEGFLVVVKSGVNQFGSLIRFYLNFSQEPQTVSGTHPAAQELLTGAELTTDEPFELKSWGVRILES